MAQGGGDDHTMRPPGRCCSFSTAVCEAPAESCAALLWVNTPRHAAGGGYGPDLGLWARRCLPGRAPGHQLGSQHLQEQVRSQGAGQAIPKLACSWRLSTGCVCSLSSGCRLAVACR